MVTARELARRLRVDPKRLRVWLRARARAGHPELSGHVPGGRWEFTEEAAEHLAGEFLSGTAFARTTVPARARGGWSPRRASRPAVGGAEELPPLSDEPGHRVREEWMGQEVWTLEDLLPRELLAVVVGINPTPVSVAAGHYYQGRAGRTLCRRLSEVGLVPPGEGPEDDRAFAAGVGFTDLVKRPTRRADGVAPEELEHGRGPLLAKLERCQPELVVFAFKPAATALFGPFDGFGFVPGIRLANAEMFVMPHRRRRELARAALDALADRVAAMSR